MIGLSTLFAFTGTFSGLLISWWIDIPSGASIIFTLVFIFGIFRLIKHFGK
jgi:zinc transport system permease protein